MTGIRFTRGLTAGALSLTLLLCASTASAAPEVISPDSSAAVQRTEHLDAGDQTAPVQYVVLRNGASVKYEDAPEGLGEDGASQTDTFVIRVRNAGDSVTVETKAARNLATSISGVGDSHLDANGFRVSLVSIDGEYYTITVKSEGARYALSHVTFTFAEGNYADPSYD